MNINNRTKTKTNSDCNSIIKKNSSSSNSSTTNNIFKINFSSSLTKKRQKQQPRSHAPPFLNCGDVSMQQHDTYPVPSRLKLKINRSVPDPLRNSIVSSPTIPMKLKSYPGPEQVKSNYISKGSSATQAHSLHNDTMSITKNIFTGQANEKSDFSLNTKFFNIHSVPLVDTSAGLF